MGVLFLGYAGGKATYAAQERLGFPGGPDPTAADHEHYAATMMDVATAQWSATVTGVVAAVLILATVTRIGRRVPRLLMLSMLGLLSVAVGSGAGIVIADGFLDLGIGWLWWQGVAGLVVLYLLARSVWAYVAATRA